MFIEHLVRSRHGFMSWNSASARRQAKFPILMELIVQEGMETWPGRQLEPVACRRRSSKAEAGTTTGKQDYFKQGGRQGLSKATLKGEA